MAPTHSGATAPVRAQGPARYSVLEHGLQQQAPKRKLVTWGGGAWKQGQEAGWVLTESLRQRMAAALLTSEKKGLAFGHFSMVHLLETS